MKDFILEIPKWEGYIAFSEEVITLVLVVIALIAGVLLCFWGYRYFQTIALVLFGCLFGAIGYKIGAGMTDSDILQMTIFVMFTFLGVCLLYFVSMILVKAMEKLRLQSAANKVLNTLISIAGAAVVGVVTYTKVYHNLGIVLAVSVILGIGGIVYGIKKAENRKVFRTYDHLAKMKPLTEEEIND